MTKTKSRFMSIFLTIVMAFTMNVGILASTTENANAASHFSRHYIRGGGDITSKFRIAGMTGLCQHGGPMSSGSGSATMSKLGQNSTRTKLAYYYGYKKGWTSGSKGCKLARAFNYARGGGAYHASAKTLRSMINTAKKQTVPANFVAYVCYPKNKSQSFVAWKMKPGTYVKVYKRSTNANSTKSSQYSLSGAVFKVYKSNKKTVVATLTTNAKGNTPATKSLAAGTYYIKEAKAPKGYTLNTKWHKVTLKSGTKAVTIKNTPKPIGIMLKKVLKAGSTGTVKGFKFVITNIETKQKYERTTDASGNINITGLMAGKYEIKEVLTTAQIQDKYKIVTRNPQTVTVAPGGTGKVTFTNERKIEQDLAIIKKTTDNGPVEGFTFNVKGPNYDQNLKTNENGEISVTNAKPGEYTVTEVMTPEQVKRYHQPEPQTLTLEAGSTQSIVFEFENVAKQFPVKLKKTSNDGKVQGITFTVTGKTFFGEEVSITKQTDKDGNIDFGKMYPGEYVVEETGFDDDKYENLYPMEGKENPAKKLVIPEDAKEDQEFNVSFENKVKSYLLISKVDQATDNFLSGAQFEIKNSKDESVAVIEITRDKNKKPIVKIIKGQKGLVGLSEEDVPEDFDDGQAITFEDAAESSDTPSGDSEPVDPDVPLNNDATGTQVPAGNDTDGDGDIDDDDASDEDIDDDEENHATQDDTPLDEGDIEITEPEDNNSDVLEGDELAIGEKNTEGVDYEFGVLKGLQIGEEYTITEIKAPEGYLPLKDPIKFVFNGKAMFAVKDKMPNIGTKAIDSDTKDHISNPDEKVTIYDEVSYVNLNPGEKYTVQGELVDKTTEKVLKDDNGKPIRSEKITFTAPAAEGKIKVPFTISAKHLAGKTTVVFEEMYYEGRLIASHLDNGDKNQTIHFPKIGTTANLGDNKEVKDVVEYRNLIPGKTYTMEGWLVDAKGNKIPNSSAMQKFTPKKANGKITMTLNGKNIKGKAVVFEECKLNGKLVGSHKDLNDRHQTVIIPIPTGDNTSWWVLGVLGLLIVIGGFAVYRKHKIN